MLDLEQALNDLEECRCFSMFKFLPSKRICKRIFYQQLSSTMGWNNLSKAYKQRSLHQISTKRIQFKIFISRTSKTYICDGPKSHRGLKLIKSMERSLSKKYHQKESLLYLLNKLRINVEKTYGYVFNTNGKSTS